MSLEREFLCVTHFASFYLLTQTLNTTLSNIERLSMNDLNDRGRKIVTVLKSSYSLSTDVRFQLFCFRNIDFSRGETKKSILQGLFRFPITSYQPTFLENRFEIVSFRFYKILIGQFFEWLHWSPQNTFNSNVSMFCHKVQRPNMYSLTALGIPIEIYIQWLGYVKG